MKILYAGFLCLVQVGISTTLTAQETKRELLKGETVTAAIGEKESHRYLLPMEKDQFALLEFMQKGVDLIITPYDPDGKVLGIFDSPNGSDGPEYVTLLSSKAGTYVLEVEPFDSNGKGGSYEVNILKLEPKAQTKAGQVDQLMTLWDNSETPGAAIAVVENGEITFEKGYGMSNLEYDVPITPSSIFHIASVSKQFTAFAILLLEAEGKLSLDDARGSRFREYDYPESSCAPYKRTPGPVEPAGHGRLAPG